MRCGDVGCREDVAATAAVRKAAAMAVATARVVKVEEAMAAAIGVRVKAAEARVVETVEVERVEMWDVERSTTWLLPRVMLWLSWNFCVSVLLNSKRAPSKMSGDRMPCASFFSSSSRGGQLLSSRLPCRAATQGVHSARRPAGQRVGVS